METPCKAGICWSISTLNELKNKRLVKSLIILKECNKSKDNSQMLKLST